MVFFLFFKSLRLLALVAGLTSSLRAQEARFPPDSLPPERRSLFSVGLAGHYGFVFAHSVDVENTRGSRPYGLRAEAVWQRIDRRTWEACACYPRNGLLVSYMDFDNRVLGQGLNAGYFLEPTFRLSRGLGLTLRGSVGLSYLSNPYHPTRNPANASYSLPLNAYLALGLGVLVRLAPHWHLSLSGQYEHASNGGLQEPNKGVNYPTASLGLAYTPRPADLPNRAKTRPIDLKRRRPRYDLTAFGTARTAERGEAQRFFIGGLSFTASKQVGRLSALTLGTEAFSDYPSREALRRAGLQRSPWRVGVGAGHEFLLGNYRFSQQLGVYAFNEIPYFSRIYHRWGLVRQTGRSWALGFNLLAHAQVANFLDLRVVKSW